ncbi:MAG: hypothetical protein AB7O65_03555 [Candidatus Korobacteraceae bacterium]
MRAPDLSHLVLWTLALFITLGALGCANRNVNMTPSSSVPAASATVKTGQDSNGNTSIDMQVQHLAPPDRLTPPATAYIVWIKPANAEPRNEGRLTVGENLSARFQTVTPAKQFEIFVTAESDQLTTTPAGQEVLRQSVATQSAAE